MNVLVVHGVNLNLLGERDPAHYGKLTLRALNGLLRKEASRLGLTLRVFQSNHEGELVDRIQKERRWMDALVINPGAFTHYSYALREVIAAVQVRAFEVHLSDIHSREKWRRVSVISEVCEAQICGMREGSYLEALRRVAVGGSSRA